MPFKFNAARRHHIPRARYRVTNWSAYDRGLILRGDIRMWISAEAIEGWRPSCRNTPGGQRRFSNLAIETTLMLGALARFPLRQTEGFVRSLMALLNLDRTVPDHTTLARRRRTVDVCSVRCPRRRSVDIVIDSTGLKFYGAGEWARAKHGETRRSWRKLHISVNADDNEIIAHELTDDDTSDSAMIGQLVANSGGNIRSVIADGAYDGEPTYQAIRAARPARSPPRIVIPPGKRSIPEKGQPHGGSERERHAAEIALHGRMAWQRRHEYGKRSLVETAISCIKRINDGHLTSRTFGAQQNEVAIHIKIANRNMVLARPLSERVR
ncbi:IS5 family transposase [Mesorhizobium sp. A556]